MNGPGTAPESLPIDYPRFRPLTGIPARRMLVRGHEETVDLAGLIPLAQFGRRDSQKERQHQELISERRSPGPKLLPPS